MTQNARQLPLTSADSGGALNQQYLYDANGNVSSITDALDPARSKTMSYDALDRLTSATSASFGGNGIHQFSYDPLDNLRSWTLGGVKDLATYVYDTNNRLTGVLNTGGAAVHSFAYDLQGNLSNKNSLGHDFDFGNRLRAVPGLESYRYDGLGRRVMSAKASGAQTLWQYSQAGQLLFAWKGPTAQTTHEYVYLAGSLVATIDHAWPSNAITATKYQHTDALGSPIALSNEAGTVIERTNYDPYGGPIGKVVDGIGYTGHVMDGLTGLTNMQQRYYDQGVGRFLSVDPVTASSINGGNFSRYWYANNNPYKFTDPDGRAPKGCGDLSKPCAPKPKRDVRSVSLRERALAGRSRFSGGEARRMDPQDHAPTNNVGSSVDYLGVGLGVADMAAGMGEVGVGLGAFLVGAASGTDDGAFGVLVASYGTLTFLDGAINIANATDGGKRESAFVQAGDMLLGPHGARVGQIAGIATPTSAARGLLRVFRRSANRADAEAIIRAKHELEQGAEP